MDKVILSLFDYSGNWSLPYHENGYEVIQVDIKLGIDILNFDYKKLNSVYGILAAIPCTDYALSGARWFKEKDIDGRTAYSQKLVAKTKEIIDFFEPVFCAIENPASRIHKLNPWMGKPKFKFNPYDFGDDYQKNTWLWGKFNIPVKTHTKNKDTNTKLIHHMSSKERPEKGSITPLGFAYAFYEGNK